MVYGVEGPLTRRRTAALGRIEGLQRVELRRPTNVDEWQVYNSKLTIACKDAVADKYSSFAELVLNEPPDAYSIRWRRTESTIAGDRTARWRHQPGTTEVALAIAGDDLSYYLFDGRKVTGNSALHIASTRFDEPICCQLIATAHFVVAIHGEASEDPVAYLGGRDDTLAGAFAVALRAVQFNVQTHDNPQLQGTAPTNTVNRGQRGVGVQLELSRGLRRTFFASLGSLGRTQHTPRLDEFARAVRSAKDLRATLVTASVPSMDSPK